MARQFKQLLIIRRYSQQAQADDEGKDDPLATYDVSPEEINEVLGEKIV